MGVPTDYNHEIAAKICGELAEGKSLVSICKPEDMPCVRVVYDWLIKHPDFMQLYNRAREDQADTLADEIIDIADDSARDVWIDKDGLEVVNHEVINRSRLRVDARKWVAAKLKPMKYGERLNVDATVRHPPLIQEIKDPPSDA